jgi:hypothetical protein
VLGAFSNHRRRQRTNSLWAFFRKKSSKAIKTLTLIPKEFAKALNTISA